MELLMTAPLPSGRVAAAPRRSLRYAVGTSVAVHAALVAAAVLVPAYVPFSEAPPIVVDVVTEVMAPPEPEAAPPPPPPPAKVVLAKRTVAPVIAAAAPPPPAATPTPAEEPTSEDAPAVAAAPEKTAGDGPPVLVNTMPVGAAGGGKAGVGVPGGGPSVLSQAQRASMIGRYRDDYLRRRVGEVSGYPAAARELELEGQVVVRITIDKAGRLRGARLAGRCPHPILCDDALRTIRAAAPFSPLPRDLGESLDLEFPLDYKIQ
jgi:periplasmic protein TonB